MWKVAVEMAGFKSCGFKPYLRQRFSASSLGYFSNFYFPIKFKSEAKRLPMYEEDSWGCVALPKKEGLTAQFDEELLGGVVKVIGKAKIIDDSDWENNLYKKSLQKKLILS